MPTKVCQDNEIKVVIDQKCDIGIFRKLLISENPQNSNTEIKLDDAVNIDNEYKDKKIGDKFTTFAIF